MNQNCANIFCGCEYYAGNNSAVSAKVYLEIGFILFVVTLSVRIGSEWFIFKDYYPMKERSPVLCILMITFASVQLIMYPIVYTYNYFTQNWDDFKYVYRTIFFGLDGSLYFLYLLRSLRLVYAHQIDASRSKTWIFKFFKHEYYLVLLTLTMIIIKVIPIIISNYEAAQNDGEELFLTYIDVNFWTYNDPGNSKELGFGIKQTIHEFLWLSIMVYCFYIQTRVHSSYSMKNELLMVLGTGFAFNIASIGLYSAEIGEVSIVRSICNLFPEYPILQLMRDLNVALLYGISIVLPIFRKRIYHMMLPIGRHHDIVKTMRDFLMTTQFIEIFAAFLEYQDRERSSNSYSDSLQYWKKLMVIKYRVTNRNLADSELTECIESIKELITNIQDKPIKEIHCNLLINLKQSILSLQECSEEAEVEERCKIIDEINERIEELELIFLEKLDQIYKSEFRQTKSYYYLKIYMMSNKKININMITMGMAVMVETEETL